MIDSVSSSTSAATTALNAASQRSSEAALIEKEGDFALVFGGLSVVDAFTSATGSNAARTAASSSGGLTSAIATATARVVDAHTGSTAATSGSSTQTASQTVDTTDTAASTAASDASATGSSSSSGTSTGVQALVSAIEDGSLQVSYVTDPSQLESVTPFGTSTMPNCYYASDQTAEQIASLLGGTVVQMPAFGQETGWSEPKANWIELSDGQTVNAADLAYYARAANVGTTQLTADLTQTINEGAAWANYYKNGGQMPSFDTGYVGAPVEGSTYASDMIGADGNVINPAMQPSGTQGA
jgi:anti-sigma28 factor (negative regulator of flagellin synthesis)